VNGKGGLHTTLSQIKRQGKLSRTEYGAMRVPRRVIRTLRAMCLSMLDLGTAMLMESWSNLSQGISMADGLRMSWRERLRVMQRRGGCDKVCMYIRFVQY
jgi:hypothetical protein